MYPAPAANIGHEPSTGVPGQSFDCWYSGTRAYSAIVSLSQRAASSSVTSTPFFRSSRHRPMCVIPIGMPKFTALAGRRCLLSSLVFWRDAEDPLGQGGVQIFTGPERVEEDRVLRKVSEHTAAQSD